VRGAAQQVARHDALTLLTGALVSEPLTQLEEQVYHYMIDFLAENTYQPSVREIARQFRIKSTKTVSDLLHALEGKGYIQRDESRSRGVRLIGFAGGGATQPIAFYDGADDGQPIARERNRKAFITVDRRFLPGPDVYCVKAGGGGLASRGILDGDFVMVTPSTTPKDGDIVATHANGQTRVKVFAPGDAAVLGVVCGVFRPFREQAPAPLMPAAPASERQIS
jgi:repressor LexA